MDSRDEERALLLELLEEVRDLRQRVMTPLPAILTLSGAALQLGISVKTLRRMISVGSISVIRYEPDGHMYVSSSEVRRWQESERPLVSRQAHKVAPKKPPSRGYDAAAELEKLRAARKARRR